jgi:nucleotide-binding universal stress UspA family protein
MKAMEKVRVLCPIDFDMSSLAALDLAHALVRDNGGELYVLHVVPSIALLVTSAIPSLIKHTTHFYFAHLRLDEIARESLHDVDHHLLLRTGRPAEQILDVATELRPQMVVMATHGRSCGPHFVLGSVAEVVIHKSPCPVLTIGKVAKYESERANP